MSTLEDRVTSTEAAIGLLTNIAERQQTLLEEMRLDNRQTRALLEEARRDSRQTQRLWVRLCRKYGWLDDEDLTD